MKKRTYVKELPSHLTDSEKWQFDLHGFLVLRQVIASDRLAQMLEVIDGWLSADLSEMPCPLVRHRQEPHKTHIDHIQYGHRLFDELAWDPQIIRVVAGLTFNTPRLFHCNFTQMSRSDEELTGFHRDDSGFKFPPGFRNPHNDYQAGNGELYCSHLATWVAMADVPEGTGFCLVPGSHKSNFREPDGLKICDNPPVSITVPLQAGDMIIFSTNLLHDAAPWTESYPRMNIFQRYQLSVYFNETHKSGYPLEPHKSMISEELYELENMGREEKKVIRYMRTYFEK